MWPLSGGGVARKSGDTDRQNNCIGLVKFKAIVFYIHIFHQNSAEIKSYSLNCRGFATIVLKIKVFA